MMVSQRAIRAALALVVLLTWGAWGCSEDDVVVPASDTSSADIVDGDTTHEDTGDTPGTDACEPLTCALLNADCGTPSDGCGALLDCGTCVAPLSCSVINRCTCIPDCVDKVCGDKDGCDGTCTLGSGCCVHDCDAEGEVQCDEGAISTCGEFDLDLCRDWSEPDVCESGVCLGEACCETLCDTKECGDDGCGGVCGACASGQSCNNKGTCVEDGCQPACQGKVCGDNGCGGICGTCDAGDVCTAAGLCEPAACVPACGGKLCGDDGCGGSCGTCATGSSCGAEHDEPGCQSQSCMECVCGEQVKCCQPKADGGFGWDFGCVALTDFVGCQAACP